MRRSWNGVLRFNKLSIPLGLAPAVHPEAVEFSYMCPEHDASMQEVLVCTEGGETHAIPDVDRGYPRGAKNMIRVTKDDLAKVAPEAGENVVNITETHRMHGFMWPMLDQAYMMETDPATQGVFAAFIRALGLEQRVAIGTMIQNRTGRTVPCAIVPVGWDSAMLFTIHYPKEVQLSEPVVAQVDPVMVQEICDQLHAMRQQDYCVGIENTYVLDVMDMINAKVAAVAVPVQRRVEIRKPKAVRKVGR